MDLAKSSATASEENPSFSADPFEHQITKFLYGFIFPHTSANAKPNHTGPKRQRVIVEFPSYI